MSSVQCVGLHLRRTRDEDEDYDDDNDDEEEVRKAAFHGALLSIQIYKSFYNPLSHLKSRNVNNQLLPPFKM